MNFLERAAHLLEEIDKDRKSFTVASVMLPRADESRWISGTLEPAKVGVYHGSKWEELKDNEGK